MSYTESPDSQYAPGKVLVQCHFMEAAVWLTPDVDPRRPCNNGSCHCNDCPLHTRPPVDLTELGRRLETSLASFRLDIRDRSRSLSERGTLSSMARALLLALRYAELIDNAEFDRRGAELSTDLWGEPCEKCGHCSPYE